VDVAFRLHHPVQPAREPIPGPVSRFLLLLGQRPVAGAVISCHCGH
jgi:hypothetical protein